MKRKVILSIFVSSICAVVGLAFHAKSAASANLSKNKGLYDFKVKDIDGKDVKLKKYKGSVLLIVNTASKCGYTPQYEGLQTIYDKYKAQGFYVLGFPANNFNGQEPGTNAEIKEFCVTKFKVTFPMFAKISVKGDDQNALYKFLTDKETNPDFGGEVPWNFTKFLIDRKGNVVARFVSKDAPQSEVVTQAIEKYLQEK